MGQKFVSGAHPPQMSLSKSNHLVLVTKNINPENLTQIRPKCFQLSCPQKHTDSKHCIIPSMFRITIFGSEVSE